MMNKKGVTLIELLVTIAIMGLIATAVYNLFNVFVKQSLGVQERIVMEQKFDLGFHTMLNDFMSMSVVMSGQRDVVPVRLYTGGALTKTTRQTLRFEDSVTYDGTTYSFHTADGTFLLEDGGDTLPVFDESVIKELYFNNDEEIPRNGISFSIGLNDEDYAAGHSGSDTNIRDEYFLEFRDDDGDGRITVDGEPEDPERDGRDEDGDGLDGEEPNLVNAVVGYHVSYFLVPQSDWFQRGGKRFKWHYLVRRLHKPHLEGTSGYAPHYRIIADKVALFSIIPFKWERGEKIYLPPDTLYVHRADTDSPVDYGHTSKMNFSFEIILVTATQIGTTTVFRRTVTPSVTYNNE
ncbi:MAG TPA: prepilin-type N-terminal cleavage/methylation domain-containing protein [Firmicutes bacterium]|nr:prepilin-type N-terminal cleavage/methylation domain-containing protein [Bacillota bacterium]